MTNEFCSNSQFHLKVIFNLQFLNIVYSAITIKIIIKSKAPKKKFWIWCPGVMALLNPDSNRNLFWAFYIWCIFFLCLNRIPVPVPCMALFTKLSSFFCGYIGHVITESQGYNNELNSFPITVHVIYYQFWACPQTYVLTTRPRCSPKR